MRRLFAILMAVALVAVCATAAAAADGNVTYSGDAGQFIFAPGSDYSLTDLFPNFKDVMPGDSLTQAITVRNDASKKVKVKIYIRALGAHDDDQSREFLSQLDLRVEKSGEMEYMFDATADVKAELAEWTPLGTLYSGGEVQLNVTLDVPVTLDNTFQQKVGYLDWEFMIEEFPVDPDDPVSPGTGDETHIWLYAAAMILSLTMVILLILRRKKDKESKEAV